MNAGKYLKTTDTTCTANFQGLPLYDIILKENIHNHRM
jgi:hypothetical protein